MKLKPGTLELHWVVLPFGILVTTGLLQTALLSQHHDKHKAVG